MTQQFHKNICLYKDLYANTYCSFIHNCQKLERPQMSLNWWVERWIMVHLYNEILLSNKKEWSSDTYSNMDKSQKHYAKRKKSDTKNYTLYGFIYMKF